MSDDDFIPKRHPLPERCPRCTALTANSPFCSRCKFDLYHGEPKLKTTGQCLFCPYDGELSKEHIFGNWLMQRYRKRAENRLLTVRRPVKMMPPFQAAEVHENSENVREGLIYDNVVYNVCEVCNNGWMSRLHTKAGPLVEKLAEGAWPKFSPEEREELTRWAVMVSLNLESSSRIRSTTDFQLAAFASRAALTGWRLSVGRLRDASLAGDSYFRHLVMPYGGPEGPMKVTLAWFCIETVAFHVVGTWDDKVDELFNFLGLLRKQFLPRRIWPQYDPPRDNNKQFVTASDLQTMQQEPSG